MRLRLGERFTGSLHGVNRHTTIRHNKTIAGGDEHTHVGGCKVIVLYHLSVLLSLRLDDSQNNITSGHCQVLLCYFKVLRRIEYRFLLSFG